MVIGRQRQESRVGGYIVYLGAFGGEGSIGANREELVFGKDGVS